MEAGCHQNHTWKGKWVCHERRSLVDHLLADQERRENLWKGEGVGGRTLFLRTPGWEFASEGTTERPGQGRGHGKGKALGPPFTPIPPADGECREQREPAGRPTP